MTWWLVAAGLALTPAAAPSAAPRAQAGARTLEIEGTVKGVENDEVQITRPGRPTAELDLEKATEIRLDGKQAAAGDLRPGQTVRATFELHGDNPVAVRVEANSARAR